MKCLVTVGSGFIGQNLIKALLKEGHHVVCLDRYKPKYVSEDKITFIEGFLCYTPFV